MPETKVVQFPLTRNRRNAPRSSDDLMAAEVGKAWRAFWRKVTLARAAGLTVEIACIDENIKRAPIISRILTR